MFFIAISSVTRGKAFRKMPLTSVALSRAEMWTSRLAEYVGDGAADAVVVSLDMSYPQGQRRKEAVSVGINDKDHPGACPTEFARQREC
jgi:hypothetical protein